MTGCTALPVAMSWSTVVRTWALGMAKPTPMLPLWPLVPEPGARAMARVDADDAALHVEQRTARVAGVDRGVGLDGVDEGLVVGLARGHRAVRAR